jgi:small subunit ribosomal protein S36
MIACGGWWWVVNLIRYQTFQPETPGFPPGKRLGDDWGAYIDYLANGTIGRWWGAIGWYEMNLSRVLTYTASSIVLALLVLGIVRARGWIARNNLLLMLWPTFALFGLMTYQATEHFMDTSYVTGVSGRYLYSGIAALATGVGAGTAAFGPRVARWTPLLVFGAAAAMQVHTAYSTVQYFWVPKDGDFSDAWDALVAWTPWSTTTMTSVAWATGGVALLALVGCVVAAARRTNDSLA